MSEKNYNLVDLINKCLVELNLPKLPFNEINFTCNYCNDISYIIYINLLSNCKINVQPKILQNISGCLCNISEDHKHLKILYDCYLLYLQSNNYCTICSRSLGISNPRQLCGKTYCLNDYSDDSE